MPEKAIMDDTNSYFEFFGLRENPFAPTADPAYFYAGREHRECLFRLWSSIDSRHGIVVVLGNYGTGKTTLLRKLITGMSAVPGAYVTAVVGSPIPSWTSFALLESIVAQFGLAPAEHSFVAYMEALNQHLLDNRDRICTLIIDDAQNINKRGQMELLRLVQNLETPQSKLLNLVLFAQLEWSRVLRAAPNFEQRINVTYTLEPIQPNEIRDFVEFRLHQAGARPGEGPEFDETALQAIHAYSEGSPRVIVTLCRNVLLVAAQLRNRRVTHTMVLHTIEKTTLPDSEKRTRVAAAIAKTPKKAPIAKMPAVESAGAGALTSAGRAAQDRVSRDERAAQLLLKAAQAREDEGASAE